MYRAFDLVEEARERKNTSIRTRVIGSDTHVLAGAAAVTVPATDRPDTNRTGPFLQSIQVAFDRLFVIVKVGFVEAVNGTCGGNANIFVRVQKSARVGVQCESVHARPQRQDKHGRGAVVTQSKRKKQDRSLVNKNCRLIQDKHACMHASYEQYSRVQTIPSRNQRSSVKEKGRFIDRCTWAFSVDSKYGSDRKTSVNVLGTINGIKNGQKISHGKGRVVLEEERETKREHQKYFRKICKLLVLSY